MTSQRPYITILETTLAESLPSLRAMSDADSQLRPAPGKWSAREIIGHLIDSASNNHGRFVRGALNEDMIFPGYDQDAWVAMQNYQAAPWQELLTTWVSLNSHIARLMSAIPDEAAYRVRRTHNLHERAWSPVQQGDPVTLDWFMGDYVGHLRHHLAQIRY